jgi:glycosyltransferase involved in cell wall biosynthesis
MLYSAREWARKGHDVWMFCTCVPHKAYDINFVPATLYPTFATVVTWDAIIAWDFPYAFVYGDHAKVHVLAFQLNDAAVGVFSHVIDQYWHPSEWHARRFNALWPEIASRKQAICCTNGVDLQRYVTHVSTVRRDPYSIIYSSSPDRGLHHLLRMWPEIKSREPRATLHVYYEIARWLGIDEEMRTKGLYNVTGERAALIRPAFEDPPEGVTFHGGVGQSELAQAQLRAGLMVYPCDPVAPTEGFSMSVLEGITAGCGVITSNADAFGELWAGQPNVTILPLPVHDDTWTDTILTVMHTRAKAPQALCEMTYHQWAAVAARQIEGVESCL